jgi:hypothetical protein
MALGYMTENPTFKLEMDKYGQIIDAFAAPRQLSKNQEPAPALTLLRQADTLEDSSKRFEIAFSDAARSDDAQSPIPSVYEEDVGNDDAHGEDPFRNIEAHDGVHLARPFIESEEINGCECIGGVDGNGYDDEDPEPDIGEWCEARVRFEVR